MLNNRQGNINRRRGRNNNNQRPQANGSGRNDSGSRIDNRARGNAPQMLDKYKTLARDAQTAGDRVLTEYYHQFADHYFRVVAETRTRFEETRRPREEWDDEGEDVSAEAGNDSGNGYDDRDDDEMTERAEPETRRSQFVQRSRENGRSPRDDRDNRPERNPRPEYNRPSATESQVERETRNDNVDQSSNEGRPPFERRPIFQRAARSSNDAAYGNGGEDKPATIDLGALPPAIAATAESDVHSEIEAADAPRKRGRPKKVVAPVSEG